MKLDFQERAISVRHSRRSSDIAQRNIGGLFLRKKNLTYKKYICYNAGEPSGRRSVNPGVGFTFFLSLFIL